MSFRSPGAWAEFAIAPSNRVYVVPDELSKLLPDELVCQFPLNPLTAWGLLDIISQMDHQRILLTAGRSQVAAFVEELAVRRGFAVERLVRSGIGYELRGPRDERLASGDSIEQIFSEVASYDCIFDPIGGPATATLFAHTRKGGHIVSYGVIDDRPLEIRASTLLYKILCWRGFALSAFLDRSPLQKLASASQECWRVLAERPGLAHVSGRYALAEFKAAMQLARTSAGAGKVVIL